MRNGADGGVRDLFERATAAAATPLHFPSLDADSIVHAAFGRGEPRVVREVDFSTECAQDAEGGDASTPPPKDNLIEMTMQGYVEGFANGREEGREAGREEIRVAVGHLLQATDAVRRHRAETIERVEDEIIELALCVAERVLHTEVSQRGAEIAARLASLGVARLGECGRVTVRMNPEDLRRIALETTTHAAATTYVPDATLARGDAVVVADVGRVDARLRTQLDELRAELETRSLEKE
jgi:flagellar assembly protein FliH